jgi:hypothetical protein
MRTTRIIIIVVSVVSIVASLSFIADYHVLKSKSNLICLFLIVVSILNITSMVLSLKSDNLQRNKNG